MGDVKNNRKVEFPAYCRAFEAIESARRFSGASICGALDDGEDAYMIDVMSRGEPRDGYVSVPDYRVVLGRLVKAGTLVLSQDGIVTREGGDEVVPVGTLDAEKARYFIAGAFGADEILGGHLLDQSMVKGLGELYVACRRNSQTCMESPAMRVVQSGWNAIMEARHALRWKQDEVRRLRAECEEAIKEVKDQAALASKVGHLLKSVADEPVNMEQCLAVERDLIEMKAMAEAMAAEEREAAERARAEEERQESVGELNEVADELWGIASSYLEKARASGNPFIWESSIEKPMAAYRSYQYYPGYRDSIESAQIRHDMAIKMMEEVADSWTGYKYWKEEHCSVHTYKTDSCRSETTISCKYGIKNRSYTTNTCDKNKSYGGVHVGAFER